jgi:hypothetical protein
VPSLDLSSRMLITVTFNSESEEKPLGYFTLPANENDTRTGFGFKPRLGSVGNSEVLKLNQKDLKRWELAFQAHRAWPDLVKTAGFSTDSFQTQQNAPRKAAAMVTSIRRNMEDLFSMDEDDKRQGLGQLGYRV